MDDQSQFEAAGVADFNGDGRLDVFSGDSWYEAPVWKRHKVREVLPGKNPHYYEDFADLPLDVNRDGNIDIVTCAYFSRHVAWVEHPGDPTKPWMEHTIDLPGSMETGVLVDLNSDGKPDFLPNIGNKLRWYEITTVQPGVRWAAIDLGTEGAVTALERAISTMMGRLTSLHPTAGMSSRSGQTRTIGDFTPNSNLEPPPSWPSEETSTTTATPTSYGHGTRLRPSLAQAGDRCRR